MICVENPFIILGVYSYSINNAYVAVCLAFWRLWTGVQIAMNKDQSDGAIVQSQLETRRRRRRSTCFDKAHRHDMRRAITARENDSIKTSALEVSESMASRDEGVRWVQLCRHHAMLETKPRHHGIKSYSNPSLSDKLVACPCMIERQVLGPQKVGEVHQRGDA